MKGHILSYATGIRATTRLIAFALLTTLAGAVFDDALSQPPSTDPFEYPVVPSQASRAAPEPIALRGAIDGTAYLVGPGDTFSIKLWGETVTSMSAAVTLEGELVLPGVASIVVAGRRLDDVKLDIRERLADFYRNVEVSVSLVGLRQIQINVLGSVAAPGVYVATALDPASELIRRAGGLLDGASQRNIAITRRGGAVGRVDLVRYRNAGDMAADPVILDGDVIFVPFATAFVHVYGAVGRPGEYELVEGETIGTLLSVAGGFAPGAVTDTVEVRSFVDDVATRRELVDLSFPGGMDRKLGEGDQVYVRSLNEWRKARRVTVNGEVLHPGVYGVNEGEDRLSDLIMRAGGPTEEASLRDAMLLRSSERGQVDRELARLLDVPVGSMSDTEYAYLKTRLRGRPGSVAVRFDLALGGDESQDVLLQDGDWIMIPKTLGTVTVSGQVASPGHVTYETGKRAAHYVRLAGGYSSAAQRNRARVIRRSTGEWESARRAGALLPGDEIWVPEKPEADWWGRVRDVSTFITALATVYVVVKDATAN